MNTSVNYEVDIPGTLTFQLTPTTKTVVFVSPPGRGRSLIVLSAQRGLMSVDRQNDESTGSNQND